MGCRKSKPKKHMEEVKESPKRSAVVAVPFVIAGSGIYGLRHDGVESNPFEACFAHPEAICVTGGTMQGSTMTGSTIIIADSGNNCLRSIDHSGAVSCWSKKTTQKSEDGPIAEARFSMPTDLLADDTNGIVYVCDSRSIRVIVQDLVSTLVCGSNAGEILRPNCLALDRKSKSLYVGCWSMLWRVNLLTRLVTAIAGHETEAGESDGDGPCVRFCGITGLTMGGDGDLFLTEQDGRFIRQVVTPQSVGKVLHSATVCPTSIINLIESYCTASVFQVAGGGSTDVRGGGVECLAADLRLIQPGKLAYDVKARVLYAVNHTSVISLRDGKVNSVSMPKSIHGSAPPRCLGLAIDPSNERLLVTTQDSTVVAVSLPF